MEVVVRRGKAEENDEQRHNSRHDEPCAGSVKRDGKRANSRYDRAEVESSVPGSSPAELSNPPDIRSGFEREGQSLP